jgi:hypothetical protein
MSIKVTAYFEKEVEAKRPYINELGRIMRVVTLADGTVHNAFPDRNFRKE